MKKIINSMSKVYEDNAIEFHKQRDKSLFEKKWLDKFLSVSGKSILDVGCGSGDPIAKYLLKNGIKLWGIDLSQNMINIAKENLPDANWLQADMRNFKLDKKFSGIIAWNSFFHLTNIDQCTALKNFNDHIVGGGILMFTAGPESGEVVGFVNGQEVYHSSMSYNEYRKELEKIGMEIIDYKLEDKECNGHSVYLVRKIA